MDIRPVNAAAAGPQGLDALGASAAPAPVKEASPASPPLDPAVKLDIGPGAHAARFVRDQDTHAMVFQVVDPTSGDVLAQSPTESALRNRAYDGARARSAQAGLLSRVA